MLIARKNGKHTDIINIRAENKISVIVRYIILIIFVFLVENIDGTIRYTTDLFEIIIFYVYKPNIVNLFCSTIWDQIGISGLGESSSFSSRVESESFCNGFESSLSRVESESFCNGFESSLSRVKLSLSFAWFVYIFIKNISSKFAILRRLRLGFYVQIQFLIFMFQYRILNENETY